jgi:hypothetical protein
MRTILEELDGALQHHPDQTPTAVAHGLAAIATWATTIGGAARVEANRRAAAARHWNRRLQRTTD